MPQENEKRISHYSDYIKPLFREREETVDYVMSIVEPFKDDFDCILISGYSMALIAPIIAYKLNKDIVVVRKEDESSHAAYQVEGYVKPGSKGIIIDDFCASGRTIKRVLKAVSKTSLDIQVIGLVFYNRDKDLRHTADIPIPVWNYREKPTKGENNENITRKSVVKPGKVDKGTSKKRGAGNKSVSKRRHQSCICPVPKVFDRKPASVGFRGNR